MSVSKEEILESIAQMSVMDVVQLVEAMEEKFGVSAAQAAAAPAAAAPGAAAEAVEEKTEFNVLMKSFGDNKVGVIKAVRAITSLGLKEAKEMVEGVPVAVRESVSKEEAEDIRKQLEEAGATVEVQ